MLAVALLSYAALSVLRPSLAAGALLFLIPFGHLARLNLAIPNFGGLARFTVAGVPFTFPEVAVYVLAIAIGLRTTVYRLRLPTPPRSPSQREGEKNNFPTSLREGGRGGVGDLTPHASRLTPCFRDPWVVLPLLWMLVGAVAATGSPAGARAWGIWKAYVLAPVFLFWIIRAMTRSPLPPAPPSPRCGEGGYGGAGFRSIISALALGAFIVAALAIVQRWWPIGVPYPWVVPGKFRATSVFGYPNAVGLYLAPLVPLLIGATLLVFRSLRGRSRSNPVTSCTNTGIATPRFARLAMTLMFGCTAIVSIIAIAFARSTGALVALAVVLPVLIPLSWYLHTRTPLPPSKLGVPDAHFHDRRNRRLANGWTVGCIGVWIVASLLLTAWLPYRHEQPKWGPSIVQKLTFQKWSGSVRLAQYRETWALLRDHPIRGAGLAGYQQAIRPYHEDPRVEIFLYPHNLLLAVWVELGLAGLLIFLAILYQFFRQLFSPPPTGRGSDASSIALAKEERGWGQYGIAAAMLVILVHGLVDVPYFKNDLAMLFWVIAAIGTAFPVLDTIVSYGRPSLTGLPPGAPRDR